MFWWDLCTVTLLIVIIINIYKPFLWFLNKTPSRTTITETDIILTIVKTIIQKSSPEIMKMHNLYKYCISILYILELLTEQGCTVYIPAVCSTICVPVTCCRAWTAFHLFTFTNTLKSIKKLTVNIIYNHFVLLFLLHKMIFSLLY